jgi:hypothetical protein
MLPGLEDLSAPCAISPGTPKAVVIRLLRLSRQVFREYQRQLWDPGCAGDPEDPGLMGGKRRVDEGEGAFHGYGTVGLLCLDVVSNRIGNDGFLDASKPLLGHIQRALVHRYFGRDSTGGSERTGGANGANGTNGTNTAGAAADLLYRECMRAVLVASAEPFSGSTLFEDETGHADGFHRVVGGRGRHTSSTSSTTSEAASPPSTSPPVPVKSLGLIQFTVKRGIALKNVESLRFKMDPYVKVHTRVLSIQDICTDIY